MVKVDAVRDVMRVCPNGGATADATELVSTEVGQDSINPRKPTIQINQKEIGKIE